jgi:FkbH-like protein
MTMHESEANWIVASTDEIPREILERFAESRATITFRTLIPWGEHCTECVWPTCYSTCDLYEPREDGRCRRFVHGMVRLNCSESVNGYLLTISFKKWAKLWAKATLCLHPYDAAERAERSDLKIASMIHLVPLESLKKTLILKRYSWKKRLAIRNANGTESANCMLIECYNPGVAAVHVTFTIRAEGSVMPYQALLTMLPGFNRHRLPVAAIARSVDLSSRLDLELTPNEISEGCTLVFGALDFVLDSAWRETGETARREGTSSKPRLCKCVVWDLDGTLWDGTLVEDGEEKLRLKSRVVETLKALDERGILLSVASKNNADAALAALRRLGIAEYFVVPHINWEPKSQNIEQIAKELNIGIDTLLFVDDSPFERAQVSSACSSVVVIDAAEYERIPARPECQVPVTAESKQRRTFYKEQQTRDDARRGFDGDYFEFLRRCELKLTIRSLCAADLERVYELTQRTNQLNFSGNRYTYGELRVLINDPDLETFVLDCEDRFGIYGTVGFCIVKHGDNRIIDLMFSCRIQAKRVEHAFLSHVLRIYRERGGQILYANYRKTERNAPAGKVFEDLGFTVLGESEGIAELCFPAEREIPNDGIVEIRDLNCPSCAVAAESGESTLLRS